MALTKFRTNLGTLVSNINNTNAIDLTDELDRRYITPQMFGAVGDGSTDDYTAFDNFLDACLSEGVLGFIPASTYRIGTTLSKTITNNLELVLSVNTVLQGDTGANPLFDIIGNTRETYQFKISGGTIDMSLSTYDSGTQSGTGIALTKVYRSEIVGVVITTGDETYNGTKGDSGVTTVDCRAVVIDRCHFQGFPDSGVYFSGGGQQLTNDDDGGEHVVNQCFFRYCSNGVITKRDTGPTIITNNHFYRIITGVATGTTSNVVFPGREMIVMNNHFKFMEASAINLTWADDSHVSGNHIIDFGYDLSDVKTTATIAGIRLRGVRRASLSDNYMTLKDWSRTSDHHGYLVTDQTYDTTTRDSQDIIISGGIVRLIGYGIRILDGSIRVDVSDVKLISVLTDVDVGGSTTNCYLRYLDDNGNLYEQKDTTLYRIFQNNTLTSSTDTSPHLATSGSNYTLNSSGGDMRFGTSGSPSFLINRISSDGEFINFYRDGSKVGDISVSGGTVSLNGAHLTKMSRWEDGYESQTNSLVGTLLTNCDTLIEGLTPKHLNTVKVSDVAGDPAWAGVYQNNIADDEGNETEFFRVARKGDFYVRVNKNENLFIGALLDSAGDGTLRKQPDQSRIGPETVAKVVSTKTVSEFDDGTVLVSVEMY